MTGLVDLLTRLRRSGSDESEPADTDGGIRLLFTRYGMLIVLVLLVAGAQLAYPGFLSPQNISNILSQNAPIGIVAVGMTIVIIAGGFDLSVGSIFALGATVYASLAIHFPLPVAFVGALLGGLIVGTANGWIITRLRVNPFVATLGSGSIITGALLVYSASAPFVVNDPSFQTLGAERIGPIPIAVLLLAAVFGVGGVLLARTVFGRAVYAVGGNAEASRLSGLPVARLRSSTYSLNGLLAAFAGLLLASRLGVGQANMGANTALDAIAVVVVGGTSLLGGEGSMFKTLVGLLILATLTNLFFSLALDANAQLVAKGAIIIGAVALDALVRRTS